MLAAQLHHKVPVEFEGMEDVLTSSVFGLLRYLPAPLACHLLACWADLPPQTNTPDVEFWPRYPTPQDFGIFVDSKRQEELPDRGDSEPDVVIRTEQWLVLVEVKYQSSLDHAYDQLSREFAIGYELAQSEGRHFRLVALTAGVLPPTPGRLSLTCGVQEALNRVRHAGGEITEGLIDAVPDSLRWISWQFVYGTLVQTARRQDLTLHNERLLEDTYELLALRGLRPYSPRPLVRMMQRWERTAIPEAVWRSPFA
ncbi:MAG: hypothetical protein ACP5HS_06365 [Anaerolineae bacterium]